MTEHEGTPAAETAHEMDALGSGARGSDSDGRAPSLDGADRDGERSFAEQVQQAVQQSTLSRLDPNAAPSAGALLAAMGGVRGLVEALLPGILFLVLFTVTRDVWLAVLVPFGISVVFVVWRGVQRGQVALALAGLLGVAISAGIALFTGNAQDNFLYGFTVNGVLVLVFVVSMLIRRPIVGVIVGVLTGASREWRSERGKRVVAWWTTVLWLVVIAARLLVQVPLYLAAGQDVEGAIEALGTAKLLMGVPLYAAALWVTWLMVRTVLGAPGTGSGSRHAE